jgi:hypothetical protein
VVRDAGARASLQCSARSQTVTERRRSGPSADLARRILSSLRELQAWVASQAAEGSPKRKQRRVKEGRR